MENSDQILEAQVRREFRAKFRARMLLIVHLLLYSPIVLTIILGFSVLINDEWFGWLFLLWLVWTPIILYHMSHYYFNHGKGKNNREARIMAEVKRRKMLATDEAKFKNDDADYDTYALTDDGELFEYAEDELKQKHRA
ncbi:MAG: hypothetical protein RLP44_32505 [Aggregatilineales bacterium]